MNWGVWAMTSKTLLSSKGLITSNIKRFWWIGALYALTLFFIIPFQYMMYGANVQDEWQRSILETILNFFSGRNGLQMLMIATLPVALAALLFRYLMTSKETTMIHSLPYTRRCLYLTQLASGLVLFMAPILLIGIIMLLLKAFTSLGMYYSMGTLLQWMGLTTLFNTLFFSIAVFVGMFTGSTVAHIAFTYILHLLPVGVYMLLRENIGAWLYGFSVSNRYDPFFDKLPWFVLFNTPSSRPPLSQEDLIGYLIMTLLLFAAAGYFYKKRKLEAAGDVISFTFFRPIFKYGLTTCGMLLGGLYFRSISGGSLAVSLVGYLLSSLLAYHISEVLMQKSFRVLHTYKGYLKYAAVVSLLLVSIQLDVFGYVSRMPEADEVKKVYFGYHTHIWTNEDPATDPGYKGIYHEANTFFRDPENIKNIMALHTQLIKQPRQKVSDPRPSDPRLYIVYILKNGKYQVRQYTINEKQYAAFLKPIYESMEYKKVKYPIVVQNPEDIKWIQIGDNRISKNPLVLTDSPEMREFMALFQEEVRSMTFEEMIRQTGDHVYIRVTDNDDRNYHYALRKDFESMISWLQEKGHYKDLVLQSKDIEYAVLRKEGTEATVEIRDPEVLKELLTISETSRYGYERMPLYVDFYIMGPYGRHTYGTPLYTSGPVSDTLKGYIEALNQS